jgi:hypothetical protein
MITIPIGYLLYHKLGFDSDASEIMQSYSYDDFYRSDGIKEKSCVITPEVTYKISIDQLSIVANVESDSLVNVENIEFDSYYDSGEHMNQVDVNVERSGSIISNIMFDLILINQAPQIHNFTVLGRHAGSHLCAVVGRLPLYQPDAVRQESNLALQYSLTHNCGQQGDCKDINSSTDYNVPYLIAMDGDTATIIKRDTLK